MSDMWDLREEIIAAWLLLVLPLSLACHLNLSSKFSSPRQTMSCKPQDKPWVSGLNHEPAFRQHTKPKHGLAQRSSRVVPPEPCMFAHVFLAMVWLGVIFQTRILW